MEGNDPGRLVFVRGEIKRVGKKDTGVGRLFKMVKLHGHGADLLSEEAMPEGGVPPWGAHRELKT